MSNGATDPLTPAEIEEIARLHAEGLGRNEIARRLGRGTRTVSVCCARLGLTFDRTATEAATAARFADLAEKRSILADALTDDALRLSAQVWEPTTMHSFGGKDHTYNSKELAEPLAVDKRALMSAATAAAAQSLRLVPPVTETGEDDARSMLGKVMSGLAAVWNEQQDQPAASEGDGDAQ
ncbi:helix-turn-helix domain-containing protein [Streptomyces subrutilus]|uniref:helix-turn-helix domain-containing protein n=1 Tax=Streptomyces subrutilus TaxID=36818 RepID=UPI002E138A42|nr:helix-turn-helix domain-containing protein [Streptomyces subrutilus]